MKSFLSFALLAALTLSVACSSTQKTDDLDTADKANMNMTDPGPGMTEPSDVKDVPEAEEMEALPELSVDAVDALMKQDATQVAIYDANGPDTRMSKGTLPGAHMLTSYAEYDVSELPAAKDTKLVFYCGSTQCTASDKAAMRAMEAGYKDVCVMRAGIKGWIEAGKETAKVTDTAMPNKG